MRPPFASVLACLLAGTALAAAAQNTNQLDIPSGPSDYEEAQSKLRWKEGEVALPRYPVEADLIEFEVGAGTAFRFFIDPASLSVGDDGVVRYTLVARSASGVANISYEGMRCHSTAYKVFARGADGRWSLRQGEWQVIEVKTIQRWHNVLYREYLCPHRRPINSAAEGVQALRQGVHPALAMPVNGVTR